MKTWLRRILALVALIGSVYGLSSSVINIMMLNAGDGSYVNLAFAVIGVIFFLYGILCAIWLLEQQEGSTKANVIFWLVQLPVLVTGFFTWKISALAYLNMTTDWAFSLFGVGMGGGSSFNVGLGDNGSDHGFGLNMFALLMIVLLSAIGFGKKRESSALSGARKVAGGAVAVTGVAAALAAKGASSVVDTAGDVAGGAMDAAKATASVAGDMAGKATDIAGGVVGTVADTAGSVAGSAMDSAKTAAALLSETAVEGAKDLVDGDDS